MIFLGARLSEASMGIAKWISGCVDRRISEDEDGKCTSRWWSRSQRVAVVHFDASSSQVA